MVDHVKLFPNRPDLRFEHSIHEQILPSILSAGLQLEFSDIQVTHANYDRSPEGQTLKRVRDFRLLEMELAEKPEQPFVMFNMGMTYLYRNQEYEVAAQFLRRSLSGWTWRATVVRKAYALLTTARMCQQNWPLALACNEEGRSYYPNDAELLLQASHIYQQLGRFNEAGLVLQQLITGTDEPHLRNAEVGLRTYRGPACPGNALSHHWRCGTL